VNLTVDRCITWNHESSYPLDSNKELDHWQSQVHEVSMLHCNMMTKSLSCVSTEVINLPYYDGLIDVDNILDAFKR